MEQLNSTVRVGLFVRTLGPRSSAPENDQSTQEDQLKPLDGLEAEHLEEVGTLGVLKGFSVGVNEQGQEVVCLSDNSFHWRLHRAGDQNVPYLVLTQPTEYTIHSVDSQSV